MSSASASAWLSGESQGSEPHELQNTKLLGKWRKLVRMLMFVIALRRDWSSIGILLKQYKALK